MHLDRQVHCPATERRGAVEAWLYTIGPEDWARRDR
jgi:hypothetical protein